MYEKKDRKFLPYKATRVYWSGRPREPDQWEIEKEKSGKGHYRSDSVNFLRRFRHVQKKRIEEKIRTDPECRYHKVKFKHIWSLPNPWDDRLVSAFFEEKQTWKRHTKCRKHWQKKLKNA